MHSPFTRHSRPERAQVTGRQCRPVKIHSPALASAFASAFTLVELLTVVAIIGILAGILIPVAGRVRESARTTQCLSNIRQLGLAYQLFLTDQKDRLPPFYDTGFDGGAGMAALRPYVQIREGGPLVEGVFSCPTAKPLLEQKYTNTWLRNSYFQNREWTGFGRSEKGRKDIKSFVAPSLAILAYERWGENADAWITPNCHKSARNILFADFHVKSRPDLVEKTAFTTAVKQN
ncbi:MAG: DUF1559 domain-containing protein [Opitutaceae bacterium]|jgi:prepilin-type N-terminal cleavage/methylation domain-containing protein/prepilin-type processing-associated H-X9-DG protein|nr:DUF1559 domain-containing protein [Opitutaceae bacterium]